MPWALLLSVTIGVMLSPESLILLGHHLGHLGPALLGWLALAALLMLCTARNYTLMQQDFPGPGGEAQCLRTAFGTVPAMVLPLCARLAFTTCACTSMLAIAGYVFNEIFVYWFPNLGFSFYLLGFLLLLNLCGQRLALWAQGVFVSVVLAGLGGLALIGLAGLGEPAVLSTSVALASPPVVRSAALSLGFFLGCELSVFLFQNSLPHRQALRLATILGIGLVWVTFCAWGLTSLQYVSRQRLAEISVPHLLTARAVFGQPGRMLMGMVVLAGASSAVNALFIAGSRMFVGMAQQGLAPSCLAWQGGRAPLPLLLLALGPAAMMYMGMAGEPETEVFIRGSVVFWLGLYLAVHLARWRALPAPRSWLLSQTVTSCVGALGLAGSILALLWSDPERGHLLVFMLAVVAGVTCYSLGWLGWQRYRGNGLAISPR